MRTTDAQVEQGQGQEILYLNFTRLGTSANSQKLRSCCMEVLRYSTHIRDLLPHFCMAAGLKQASDTCVKIILIVQAADLEEEAVFQTALQSGTDIQTLRYARAIFFGPSYDARVSGGPEKACQASLHRSISCIVERIHCNALAVEMLD